MQFPHIHLNGTSRDGLLAPVLDALRAVQHAARALAKCAPHGRDYYTISHIAIDVAMDEHLARLRKLCAVQDELEQIAQAIDRGEQPHEEGCPAVDGFSCRCGEN